MVKTFPIEQLINLTDIHKTLEWIVLEREFRKYRYIFIIFVNAFLFRSSDEDTHNEARVKKKKSHDSRKRVCYLVYGKLFDAYVL